MNKEKTMELRTDLMLDFADIAIRLTNNYIASHKKESYVAEDIYNAFFEGTAAGSAMIMKLLKESKDAGPSILEAVLLLLTINE